MRTAIRSLLRCVFGAAVVGAISFAATAEESRDYPGVTVSIGEGAYIDWETPGDPDRETQNERILEMVGEGASEAVTAGGAQGRLNVTVTYFDILSDFEKFFCCAVNEVTVVFELVDPSSGAVLKPAEARDFDHIGRGGLAALIASARGEDQRSTVVRLIREGAADWLAGG